MYSRKLFTRKKLLAISLSLTLIVGGCGYVQSVMGIANAEDLQLLANSTRVAADNIKKDVITWRERSANARDRGDTKMSLLLQKNAEMAEQLSVFLEEKAAVAADAAAEGAGGDFIGAVKTIATLLPPTWSMPILLGTNLLTGFGFFGENKKKNQQKKRGDLFENATTELVTGIGSNGALNVGNLKNDLKMSTTDPTKDVITTINREIRLAKAVASV